MSNTTIITDGQIYDKFVSLHSSSIAPIVTGIILIIWTTLWMAGRLYCRMKILKVKFVLEDWLQLFALLCFYGDVIAYCVRASVGGVGYPESMLQDFHRARRQQANVALIFMYTISVTAIKASIIWTLSRIFSSNTYFRFASYITLAFTMFLMLSVLLVNIMWCLPNIKVLWSCDLNAIMDHCAGPDAALAAEIAMSALNLVNELIIFILPIPMVLKLKMNWRYKAGLCCIFGIGILTLICALLRVAFLVSDNWLDKNATIGAFCSALIMLEPGLGLITAASLGMKPLFKILFAPTNLTNNSSGYRRGHTRSRSTDTEQELSCRGIHDDTLKCLRPSASFSSSHRKLSNASMYNSYNYNNRMTSGGFWQDKNSGQYTYTHVRQQPPQPSPPPTGQYRALYDSHDQSEISMTECMVSSEMQSILFDRSYPSSPEPIATTPPATATLSRRPSYTLFPPQSARAPRIKIHSYAGHEDENRIGYAYSDYSDDTIRPAHTSRQWPDGRARSNSERSNLHYV